MGATDEQPRSRFGVVWDLALVVLAVVSLVPVFWVEMEDLRWPDPAFKTLATVDLVIVLVFAGDLGYALWRARDRWALLRQRWYELPSLVPLYAESIAVLRVSQLLRLTRLLRVLRTITALRHLRSLTVLDRLINRHKLLHTSLISTVVVLVLAFVVWLLERDTNPSLSHFSDALWWAIVTTTTVGYGDITPQTGLARLFATGLMLMGIGLIAMLASSCSAALISIDNEQAAAAAPSSLVVDLERLAALHERGRLSDDEFAAAKRKLLA
jgi:voltage-gated potassium channel